MPRRARTLPQGEKAELARQGAKAAARGDDRMTNPISRQVNSPAATGESTDSWKERREAWNAGHDHQTSQAPAATDNGAPLSDQPEVKPDR